jgi:hypothetical protein
MGGEGSTRWRMTVTRATTEGLPRLDVRALAQAGALRPGVSATVTWDGSGAITTEVPRDRTDELVLRYTIRRGMAHSEACEERIPLVTTPCTFGGERVWVACPGCGARCAVLYGRNGLFRCGGCHDLAYASTRHRPPPRCPSFLPRSN